jgi:riboflavin synthase
MFTGIIQHVGEVLAAEPSGAGRRLRIDIGPLAAGLQPGQSVAVAGACLTACEIAGQAASFDVVHETLQRTTLGQFRTGSCVNLEPALAATGRFDGHIVQGHIDALGTVAAIDRSDGWVLRIAADSELLDQLVPKGSIAIDGVSLTLAQLTKTDLAVAIIPTTLAETTLGNLAVGEPVNIETDILGKYVRRYLSQTLAADQPARPAAGGLTMEKLRDAGMA